MPLPLNIISIILLSISFYYTAVGFQSILGNYLSYVFSLCLSCMLLIVQNIIYLVITEEYKKNKDTQSTNRLSNYVISDSENTKVKTEFQKLKTNKKVIIVLILIMLYTLLGCASMMGSFSNFLLSDKKIEILETEYNYITNQISRLKFQYESDQRQNSILKQQNLKNSEEFLQTEAKIEEKQQELSRLRDKILLAESTLKNFQAEVMKKFDRGYGEKAFQYKQELDSLIGTTIPFDSPGGILKYSRQALTASLKEHENLVKYNLRQISSFADQLEGDIKLLRSDLFGKLEKVESDRNMKIAEFLDRIDKSKSNVKNYLNALKLGEGGSNDVIRNISELYTLYNDVLPLLSKNNLSELYPQNLNMGSPIHTLSFVITPNPIFKNISFGSAFLINLILSMVIDFAMLPFILIISSLRSLIIIQKS